MERGWRQDDGKRKGGIRGREKGTEQIDLLRNTGNQFIKAGTLVIY